METKISVFEKLKFAVMVIGIVVSLIAYFDIKAEMRTNKSEFTAWHTATQNVTNRFIGRLEGLGQRDTANILRTLNEEIEAEKNKQKEVILNQ